MRILQILAFMFVAVFGVVAQHSNNLFTLNGTVYDQNKALLPKTEIVFKNTNGQNFKTESLTDGSYKIKIPFGNYTVEFYRDGFKRTVVENFVNNSLLETSLDADLEFGFCESLGGSIVCREAIEKNKFTKIDFAKLKGEVNKVTVSDSVADENGVVFPEVIISFKNEFGEKLRTKTNIDGNYTIKLPIGIFSISAQASEFLKNTETKIEIKKSESVKQNIIMFCMAKERERCYSH